MKRILISIFTFILVSGVSAQDVDPAMFYPDDTNVYGAVGDLSKLHGLDEGHPLRKFIAHPGVVYVFGESFEGGPNIIDEEFLVDIGMDMEDLAKAFPGHVSAGVRLPIKELIASLTGGLGGEPVPEIAITADCTLAEEELVEMLEGIIKHRERLEEDYEPEYRSKFELVRQRDGGHTVFRIEEEFEGELFSNVFSVVLVDGVLVLSFEDAEEVEDGLGEGLFAEVVERVESGGRLDDALGGTDQYLDVAEELRAADFMFFAPFEELAEMIEALISAAYEDSAEAAALAPKEAVLKTIGLRELQSFSVSGSIVEDGVEMYGNLGFSGRAGALARIFNYEGREIELPEFSPEGITAISVTSLDYAGLMELLLDTVKRISPMGGAIVEEQLKQMETQGIPIRKGILGSMAPGSFSIAGYSREDVPKDSLPSRLLVFALSDPEGMRRALDAVRTFAEKLGWRGAEKKEFMGLPIFELEGLVEPLGGAMGAVDPGSKAAYAIVGDKLLFSVGEADFLKHAISSMKEKGADLLENEVIEAAWDRWDSKDMVEFSYMDMAEFVKEVAITSAIEMEQWAEQEEIDEYIENLPELEDLKYSLIVKSYDTPESLSFRMAIVKNP